MKEKTVKIPHTEVGLKYHRRTFAWSVTHTHSKSKMIRKKSVLRCKFLGFSIARVKLRQTGTLNRDPMIEDWLKKKSKSVF